MNLENQLSQGTTPYSSEIQYDPEQYDEPIGPEMLKKESGKRFDSNVVAAFMRYYSKIHAGEPDYRIATM